MRFLHLTDINGKHHLVNPLHIVSIEETDAGCTVHMRGRGVPPILLNETVELMGDALATSELDDAPVSRIDH
ncbi:MAG TPA: hypothetical protein VK530_04395 [Candidatus Acidoferrum sp.]|nr:hypothetical protein [Candidatus Acidoferrum sp.]